MEGKQWTQGETASPLRVLTAKLFFTGLGEMAYVIGDLKNGGDEAVTAVTITFRGYGVDGTLLDDREGEAPIRHVAPGAKEPFKVQADLREVTRFELIVNSQPAETVPDNPLQVVSSTMGEPRMGSSWIEGEVENAGDTAVDGVEVIAVLRNADGEVVEVAITVLPESLEPGVKAAFRYMATRRGATAHEVFAQPAR